jgi:hypothetical protein
LLSGRGRERWPRRRAEKGLGRNLQDVVIVEVMKDVLRLRLVVVVVVGLVVVVVVGWVVVTSRVDMKVVDTSWVDTSVENIVVGRVEKRVETIVVGDVTVDVTVVTL